MSLFIASLNSGSNGNCYYVGNQEEGVFIDTGISCRETEKRMKRLGLSIRKVKAIFISHEHGDHTHGATTLSRKYQIPVYINQATRANSRIEIKDHLTMPLIPHLPVQVGGLCITPFPKLHDATDPLSFTVASDSVCVGVLTDIGSPCEHVIHYFSKCHAAFLESNYDESMLTNGRYPLHLKTRIRSDVGHLSNDQAMALFLQHRPGFMSHLFLSHLSQDNNSPRLVKELFTRIAGSTEIIVASRKKESPLYHIRSTSRKLSRQSREPVGHMPQLALF